MRNRAGNETPAAVFLGQRAMWAWAGWELQPYPSGPDPDPQRPGSTPPSAFTFSPLLAELGNIYLKLPHPWRGWSDGDCISPWGDPSGWVRDNQPTWAFQGRAQAAAHVPLCLISARGPRQTLQLSHWNFLWLINRLVLIACSVFRGFLHMYPKMLRPLNLTTTQNLKIIIRQSPE